MPSSFTAAQRNIALDAIRASYNAGLLRIFSGSAPANADAALGGATQLAELTLNATAFPAASGGVLTANAITRDNAADATGTASFFRLLNAAGSTVLAQGAVGTSGAEMIVPTTSVVTGQPFECSSLTITIPASV
jgi:hypothetical protein